MRRGDPALGGVETDRRMDSPELLGCAEAIPLALADGMSVLVQRGGMVRAQPLDDLLDAGDGRPFVGVETAHVSGSSIKAVRSVAGDRAQILLGVLKEVSEEVLLELRGDLAADASLLQFEDVDPADWVGSDDVDRGFQRLGPVEEPERQAGDRGEVECEQSLEVPPWPGAPRPIRLVAGYRGVRV